MSIKAASLLNERRKTTVTLICEEDGETREESLELSFKKLTPKVWRELYEVEDSIGKGTNEEKSALVRQCVALDIQSKDILDEVGRPYNLKEEDYDRMDVVTLRTFIEGVTQDAFPKMTSLPPTEDTSSKTVSSDASPSTQT